MKGRINDVINDINKIIELAVSCYKLLEETITLCRNVDLKEKQRLHEQLGIKLDFLLEKIEDLNDDELNTIKSDKSLDLSDNIILDILALKNKIEDIDDSIDKRDYEGVKTILAEIINLARIELKKETETKRWFKNISRRPLYNGTNLAIIFAVLSFGEGFFGIDKTFFYVKQEDAKYYAESTNVLNNVREIYRHYGKDFDKLFNGEQKRQLLKGFILEFDQNKVGNVKFNGIEEGRIEFVLEDATHLSCLTKRCKKQLMIKLGIEKDSELYQKLS